MNEPSRNLLDNAAANGLSPAELWATSSLSALCREHAPFFLRRASVGAVRRAALKRIAQRHGFEFEAHALDGVADFQIAPSSFRAGGDTSVASASRADKWMRRIQSAPFVTGILKTLGKGFALELEFSSLALALSFERILTQRDPSKSEISRKEVRAMFERSERAIAQATQKWVGDLPASLWEGFRDVGTAMRDKRNGRTLDGAVEILAESLFELVAETPNTWLRDLHDALEESDET